MPTPDSSTGVVTVQPPAQPVRWASTRKRRVCDRCIKQKIKCDLNQPRCSACAASGCPCFYSYTRKRPGPNRGSSRPIFTPSSTNSLSCDPDRALTPCEVGVTAAASPPSAVLSVPSATEGSWLTYPQSPPERSAFPKATASSYAVKTLADIASKLAAETRHELEQIFATTIIASFPLFRLSTFHHHMNNGEIGRDLASIIYAIAGKLNNTWRNTSVDTALNSLVDELTVRTTEILKTTGLNEWRIVCLVAWYGFYQHSGQNVDLGITILVRKTYSLGLHQMDNSSNLSAFGWELLGDDTLEDWRHVWWSIYLLDTYSCYTSATPAQIQPDSIGTALLRGNQTGGTDWTSAPKVFIPAEQADLWQVTQEIVAAGSKGTTTANLHIVVTALLKEVLTVHLRARQNPRCSVREKLSDLEDCLCGMQLSLPLNYTRATRGATSDETPAEYHCRLLTLVKTHTILMLLGLPGDEYVGGLWETRWRDNLETCQRTQELICQWDFTQYPFTADPGICLIVMALLVMMQLHSKLCIDLDSTRLAQLTRRQGVLRLILHNHAKQWMLAQLLLGALTPVSPVDLGLSTNRETRQLRFVSEQTTGTFELGRYKPGTLPIASYSPYSVD